MPLPAGIGCGRPAFDLKESKPCALGFGVAGRAYPLGCPPIAALAIGAVAYMSSNLLRDFVNELAEVLPMLNIPPWLIGVILLSP
jgi:hypothetical protein